MKITKKIIENIIREEVEKTLGNDREIMSKIMPKIKSLLTVSGPGDHKDEKERIKDLIKTMPGLGHMDPEKLVSFLLKPKGAKGTKIKKEQLEKIIKEEFERSTLYRDEPNPFRATLRGEVPKEIPRSSRQGLSAEAAADTFMEVLRRLSEIEAKLDELLGAAPMSRE